MIFEIPTNNVSLNEKEMSNAVAFINEGIANEKKRIANGYSALGVRLFVCGGGFANDNGVVLYKAEAETLVEMYKRAGYHCYYQWTPRQHYMRAIIVSCSALNLSPMYYEKA